MAWAGLHKILSKLLPDGVKKMSITRVCRSGLPEMDKGNSLDSIAFVSRKSRPEKYKLTNRKKNLE